MSIGINVDLLMYLAIECDEKYHSTDNNQTNDILRQNYITQKLGCVFIRCNPQNKGFNLFELLNKYTNIYQTIRKTIAR